MSDVQKGSMYRSLKDVIIGRSKDLNDPRLFKKITLIAFFAWIGLGADGLSSSCYGPQEAFIALQGHMYLGVFVALLTVVTIFIISSSYSQIIELFPTGGGGYLVASKLLSPTVGMVSGCALLVDYVLTITLSIASGADAVFSFLPLGMRNLHIFVAVGGVLVLMVMNLRGVKESVLPLVPLFILFLLTHTLLIGFALLTHVSNYGEIASKTMDDAARTSGELGLFGMLLLILHSYSLGAGTYTGIEAVSNGIPILKQPRVQTAKTTMRYMAFSLALVVLGLMLGYVIYGVSIQPGKTLNAVLLADVTSGWNPLAGTSFVLITLFSEAILLFVAAQTGFLDGPRVLANMALDRWFPSQFSNLSDRFVTQNGVLLMGAASLGLMLLSQGSVGFLVVLYSINVFITFLLSQLGMVRHWWLVRGKERHWEKKIIVNGIGLSLTAFILVSVVIVKFDEGGWMTLFITGSLILLALLIKRHYAHTYELIKHLDGSVLVQNPIHVSEHPQYDPKAKTAVIFVNDYNGLGVQTFLSVRRVFGDSFKNFLFLQVGIIDAGNFKGVREIEKLKEHVENELKKYVEFAHTQGYYAEAHSATGTDQVIEVSTLAEKIHATYPTAVFFGGQAIFEKDTFSNKLLYNQTIFSVQRKLYQDGIPFMIMPIPVA